MALVLVVEDDPTMAEMVSYNLRRQGLEVDVARDGPSGLLRARRRDVSLVLLDVMLPNLDGVQVAEQLRALRPNLPILMLTARGEAIRSESPSEVRFGDLRLVARDFRCWVGDTEVALRPKEFSLLARLASEPGRLFSRLELAEEIWGYSHLGDTRTIDTHVKNLRRKVEDDSDYLFIETVRGLGYRFRLRLKAGEPGEPAQDWPEVGPESDGGPGPAVGPDARPEPHAW